MITIATIATMGNGCFGDRDLHRKRNEIPLDSDPKIFPRTLISRLINAFMVGY